MSNTPNRNSTPLYQADMVTATVRLLVGADNVTELRVLDATTKTDRWLHTASGYFDDPDKLAEALRGVKTAKGIYITPNPVDPSLLARAANRIRKTPKGESTQDTNILRRRWLLIDTDPQRASGISATDAEHEAALERVRSIFAYLRDCGWPDPIAADSGNGAHLLYQIDLPPDDGGLVQRCLAVLADRFDDETVKVDQTVYNPARIWKLYGTLACKGDDTPDRPHRMARILSRPDELLTVELAALEALANELSPRPPAEHRHHTGDGNAFELEAFIVRNNLDAEGPAAWNGQQGPGKRWTFRTSPLCDHHDGAAFLIEHASGAITAGCHHNSCSWEWRNLRNRYEPDGDHKRPDTQSEPEGPERKRCLLDGEKKATQATILIGLAEEGTDFWHTPDGDAYATIPVGDHHENWPVRSKAFRRWLAHRYYVECQSSAHSQARQDAIGVMEGKAIYDGMEMPVYNRLAEYEDAIYLDLCNKTWQAVKISTAGWELVDLPPMRFRRAKAMLSLSTPNEGGSVDDLRSFVNVTDTDWPLLVAWVLAALRPRGPYPLLCLHGEQGSAKSTTARVLRALVDPNSAPLRCEPKEPRDLMIAANNAWVLALDNLSRVPVWLSDALCRLSTGGGFSTRTLYENDEETIFNAMRPVILNGIEELPTRGDLLDRSLVVSLPNIPENKRRPEGEFWKAFGAVHVSLVGAMLTMVSAAMKKLPSITIETLPRMADFALWATAGEITPGAFMAAYTENKETNNALVLEASPAARVLLEFIDRVGTWTGTPTDLLGALDQATDEKTRKLKTWPKTPGTLSGILKRLAPNLRKAGLEIDTGRTGRQRAVSIRRSRESCVTPVTRVTDSSLTEGHGDGSDADDAGIRTHSKEVHRSGEGSEEWGTI